MTLTEIKKQLADLPRTSFGISVPHLRKLAAQIARKDYQTLIEHNDYSSFELKLLHAFTIGYIKADIDVLLKYFADFIPYVDDWGINDSLCQNFKIARRFPEKVWQFLHPLMSSPREFESRIVAVMLLSHYLNDDYIKRVINVFDSLSTNAYYSQMGVAWGLATVMGKYPHLCLQYLNSSSCRLDDATWSKTLQKIRESYRVSAEIKQSLGQIRRP